MKTETYDGRVEREVLTGMITDKAVIASITPRWSGGLFASRYSNLLGSMAVNYYKKYHKAPGLAIQSLFDHWVETHDDQETAKLGDRLLSHISDLNAGRVSPLASEYVLDQAEALFTSHKLRELKDQIEAGLSVGDVTEVLNKVQSFRPVDVGATRGVKLLDDLPAIKGAMEDSGEVVIRWGQSSLDTFFQDGLGRDCFVAFEGKDKVGKSFWLQELAWLGVNQGRKVAFFEVGDQSQKQLIRRFAARAAGRPFKADGRYRVPVSITPSDGGTPFVEHEERSCDAPMTWQEARDGFRKVRETFGPDAIRLSVHPNDSVSVLGIEAVIEGWERDGWVPDAVFVDYADILAPINGKADTRDQINATWKALRRLSQNYHCLLVTATQSDAAGYDAKVLKRHNFSEDKRKNSHVTGMVGINQTDKEKEQGLYRLNWVVGRDLEFSETKCVYTASCLALANPCVKSCF